MAEQVYLLDNRADDAGMRLRAAELRADCALQLDDILHGEVTNAAVSL